MSSTFKIIFYLKGNQINKNGKATIMVRVTVNGVRTQFSAKLEIEPSLWENQGGKAKGKSVAAQKMNTLLDQIRNALTNIYRDLSNTEHLVTSEKVRNVFLGYTQEQQTLLKLYEKHNDDVKLLIGKSVAKGTWEKYDRTCKRLRDYMAIRLKVSDITLKEINYDFIKGFENYLMSECDCNPNTTAKFMQFFKRIVIIARNNGWIVGDPFANYKIRIKKVDRGYLTEEEIQTMLNKGMPFERLELVRDIFVFACYTGLSYIDVKYLTHNKICKSFDGSLWIMTKRHKTDITENVPLLPIPLAIIEKYKNDEKRMTVLPVLSNQKMNAYLKEIADICFINKNLTFHLARHSFATILLSKGVSIESVSKMLGHTNIKTTQIYARITDQKVSNEMKKIIQLQDAQMNSLVVNG